MSLELSHRLQVRQLGEGKTKYFKLINSGRKDKHVTDSETKLPVAAFNAGATFEGYFTIFDKYEKDPTKKKKILKNVIGSAIVIKEGKEVLEEIVDKIEFNGNGICICKQEEYNKLVCLTRANENKSNPYRNKSVPAIWEEVDEAATQEDIINDLDMAFNAEKYAMECDVKEAQSIAEKYKIKYNGPQELRLGLRLKAKENPKEFFKNTKDKDMKLKLTISDAMKLKLLDLSDANEWILLEKDSDKPLVKVEAGQEPYTVLTEFLNKNKEELRRLNTEVDNLMHQPLEA